jgi:hypothetical protein
LRSAECGVRDRGAARCAFARGRFAGIVGGVNRFLFGLGLTGAVALATPSPAPTPSSPAPALRERVLGAVQPEIRLNNGTVFKNTKVLGVSVERGTATLSDSQRIRTVPLTELPSPLREHVLEEAARSADRPRYNTYREEVRATPPPDKVITPPAREPITPTITDRLITQATAETPDELKLHLMRTNQQVSSLTTKIRKVEQVPGWQKIRATGDAAFAVWDNSRRDYVWRTEKFEVEFAIVNGTSLKLERVTFGGISRQAPID